MGQRKQAQPRRRLGARRHREPSDVPIKELGDQDVRFAQAHGRRPNPAELAELVGVDPANGAALMERWHWDPAIQDDREAVWAQFVADAEARYRHGDPFGAWQAYACIRERNTYFRGRRPEQPMPEWVLSYLEEAATALCKIRQHAGITAKADPPRIETRKIETEELFKRIAQALRMKANGAGSVLARSRNAGRDYHMAWEVRRKMGPPSSLSETSAIRDVAGEFHVGAGTARAAYVKFARSR